MDNSSTPSTSAAANSHATPDSPRKQTVAFLKQFARIYTYEPRLKPQIAALIPN